MVGRNNTLVLPRNHLVRLEKEFQIGNDQKVDSQSIMRQNVNLFMILFLVINEL